MEIELTDQETTDFDWFGVDEEGLLGHFASAGFKRLPQTVCRSAEDLKLVSAYFLNQAVVKGSHKVDRHLTGDLSSFVSMADKGLFSFDIDSYVKPGISYFRVASPEVMLTLRELPDEVQRIVSRTVLKGVRLRSQLLVPYDATLLM